MDDSEKQMQLELEKTHLEAAKSKMRPTANENVSRAVAQSTPETVNSTPTEQIVELAKDIARKPVPSRSGMRCIDLLLEAVRRNSRESRITPSQVMKRAIDAAEHKFLPGNSSRIDDSGKQTQKELEKSQMSPTTNENVSTPVRKSTPETSTKSADDSTPIKQNAEQIVDIANEPVPSSSDMLPFDRLLESVKRASQDTLISSYQDIIRDINDADYDFLSKYPVPVTNRRMKREFESVGRMDASQSQAMGNSAAKKPRNQPNYKLLTEIKMKNDKLMETVITALTSENDETVVTCTYTPLSLSEKYRMTLASLVGAASVTIEFLVSSDYPSSPPTILSRPSEGCSERAEHFMKAIRSKFKGVLDHCSGPLRIADMAQAWNDSAQSVYQEYAKNTLGLQTFSSRFGSWEPVSQD